MKHTENYNLNKIELTDSPPDITALNPNFDKIDTELKRLTDKDTEIVKSIDKVKEDCLPKTGGNVTQELKVKNKTVAVSVNGEVADANGNITIDVGGDVQSVNGVEPDENGNVELDLGGDVASVDGVTPDENGNVEINASTRDEILEGAKRVTDVEVDPEVAKVEALQTGLARVESSYLPLDGSLPMTGAICLNAMASEGDVVSAYTDDQSKELIFASGNSNYRDAGAYLSLYGRNHPMRKSAFSLMASDGESYGYLIGDYKGALRWMDQDVTCVTSISVGNPSYVRFNNGLQIVWYDNLTIASGGTVTFPVPFNGNPSLVANHGGTVDITIRHFAYPTHAEIHHGYPSAIGVKIIAIGFWG